MAALWKDVRYTLRILRSNLGFAAVAVVALALGIGANTAIFSVVNAVLLQPLPFSDPHRIMVIHDQFTSLGLPSIGVSAPDFLDISAQKDIFENTAALDIASFNLTGSDKPERLLGIRASAGFFPLMGVKPIRGRWFLPEEDKPGVNLVVVITEGLWKRLFASAPGVVGKPLQLNGKDYTVLGIMPSSFQFAGFPAVDLWTPIAFTPAQLDLRQERGHQWLFMLARLKPGVRVEKAQAAMKILAKRFQQQYPNNFPDRAGWGILVVPLLEELVGNTEKPLVVLLAAVAFVLLIACANVANLMLARASARYKEMAIRSALGAGRLRIARQLLTECLLLALMGGALGLLIAVWVVDLLRIIGPDSLARLRDVKIDGWVLGFTFLVSCFAGVLFGLMPALQASRSDLHESLKEGGRSATAGARRQRIRSVLVVSEVALALVLLVGAGLMLRSFLRLRQVESGFDPTNVLTMQLALPESKYAKEPQIGAFYQSVLQRVSTLPGVQSVGAVSGLPFGNEGNWSGSFTIESRPAGRGDPEPHANIRIITPDYFRALRIPLRQGRYFSDADGASASKVVIIDDVLAKTYWPNENPLGKRVTFDDAQKGPFLTVVGIVRNVKYRELDAAPKGVLYLPLAQSATAAMALVIRTQSEPTVMAAAVRSEVLAVDKDQPIYDIKTMEQRLAESVARRRFAVWLLAVFAGMALILAAVGIYGVMSYAVTQRTHEIGIRMALGARQADVLRRVVGQGMLMTIVGVGIGLAGALAITQLLESLLFGVTARDPWTFVAVAALLTGVAATASYIPARRATKVDPVIALRYE